MYDTAILNRDQAQMLKRRLSRWITKEQQGEGVAQILIPKTDFREPMFESDFTWLMFNRYKIVNYEFIYRRMLKGLRSGLDEMMPFLIDLDGEKKTLKSGRMVGFVYYEKTVLIRILGRKPKNGIQGGMLDFRFNHSRIPGKHNKDGSINWYELDKFTVVEQGQVLGTFAVPVEGECGVSIFNEPILPKPLGPLELKFGDGVAITPGVFGEAGRETMQISAKVGGVLVYQHTNRGVLTKINVVREIRTKSICFETGNLGDKEVRIPVPISLEEFRPNFRLYSTALVRCDEIYGGFISTEDVVEIGIVNSDSHIWAGKKIQAEYVQKSSLEAPEVSITRTIMDVKIKADRFTAQGEALFPVTNTEVDAISVFMNQVLIQGANNVIDLGGRLIRGKLGAKILSDQTLEQMGTIENARRDLLEGIKKDLLGMIKKAATDRRGKLIEFAKKMNTYPESQVMTKLDRFKSYDNLNKVEALKKKLCKLIILKKSLDKAKEQKKMFEHKEMVAGKELQRIKYRISGFIAPGGGVKIRCRDWETEYVADNDCHMGVTLSGKMGKDGIMQVWESRVRPVQNPLTYPQVRAKNAGGAT